jgi:uncharacterized protein (DUF697 family)
MALPIRLGVLRALVKEISASGQAGKPLVVGGARELAGVLRRELGRGANPGAVRSDDDPKDAAVLVYLLGGAPSEDDERALKQARRARVPIVAVVAGSVSHDVSIPYVLATDVIWVGAGEGFPLEAIVKAIAGRLGEEAAPLAARMPLLRRAVAQQLVAAFARKNGIVGAAVFVPGADLPLLALNELRLLLRLEQVYGLEIDPRERLPEIAATFGLGFGMRALARELLDLVPVAGWAVKGAVAYAGTRALGEAAIRRLEAAPGNHEISTPPLPGGAWRAGS